MRSKDFYERYGIRERTQQEKDAEQRRIDYAESLGIKLDFFDDVGEDDKEKERDRDLALYYILIGEDIPEDLMDRLMKYKKEDESRTLPYDEDFIKRYGIRERTQQEKDEEERKIAYARSLGIPLDCFDAGIEEENEQKERDRGKALYYIEIGEDIPEDLMKRLLAYKREDELSQKERESHG